MSSLNLDIPSGSLKSRNNLKPVTMPAKFLALIKADCYWLGYMKAWQVKKNCFTFRNLVLYQNKVIKTYLIPFNMDFAKSKIIITAWGRRQLSIFSFWAKPPLWYLLLLTEMT